jgi:aminoglycoside phosphotransferase (APT) family kinase protein
MSHPWTPEYIVSPALARRLIEHQFPRLAPARLKRLGAGWDNSAFIVNKAYVFRFPRRQVGAECLETEIRLLPVISERLPLPISAPVLVGQPETGFPWRFAGYPLLPGRTACVANLPEIRRTHLAQPLAHFLAALHHIGEAEAEALNAPPDMLGRFDLPKRISMARENLQRLFDFGLVNDLHPFEKIFAESRRLRPPQAASLVHGDLYARHLLVNKKGNLCGVIDWGDIHFGDPAVDLAIAHSFLPPSAHETFRHAYGCIDENTWKLARFRALYHSAALAVYGREIGDHHLQRESQQALCYLALIS